MGGSQNGDGESIIGGALGVTNVWSISFDFCKYFSGKILVEIKSSSVG